MAVVPCKPEGVMCNATLYVVFWLGPQCHILLISLSLSLHNRFHCGYFSPACQWEQKRVGITFILFCRIKFPSASHQDLNVQYAREKCLKGLYFLDTSWDSSAWWSSLPKKAQYLMRFHTARWERAVVITSSLCLISCRKKKTTKKQTQIKLETSLN